MSYGSDFSGMWSRGCGNGDERLRGAKVSDIPMEQLPTYELTANLRTAKALGIKMPNSIMVRADKVID